MTPDAKECFQTQRDWSLKILKIGTKIIACVQQEENISLCRKFK